MYDECAGGQHKRLLVRLVLTEGVSFSSSANGCKYLLLSHYQSFLYCISWMKREIRPMAPQLILPLSNHTAQTREDSRFVPHAVTPKGPLRKHDIHMIRYAGDDGCIYCHPYILCHPFCGTYSYAYNDCQILIHIDVKYSSTNYTCIIIYIFIQI
jgi:hypothetical protein